ncbi:tryptophanase [Elusimicrobiota bacterium]
MSEWDYKTIIEPFKIKSIEPLYFPTRKEREKVLLDAGYNLFSINADKITLDLLTDSGTNAMSAEQWAAMMRGDESYAGSKSFFVFERVIQDLTKLRHIIPAHQGRAAEKILFTVIGAGKVIPGNTHFDTTRANIEAAGSEALDLPCLESSNTYSDYRFKGNIDLNALEKVLKEKGSEKIPFVLMTVTNNAIGGHPVSMENLRAAKKLCDTCKIPLFMDIARFAENAYFIKMYEAGYSDKSAYDIAKEMLAMSDGCTMSAKKDGLVNIGGFLGLNSDALALECRNMLILTEGFSTYGGLAGRDLEAIAQGLVEVLDEEYLRYRIRSVEYLGEGLLRLGVPIVRPPGGHAVYVDAGRFLSHISKDRYPGQALACALYLEAGVRTCELGTVAFNGKNKLELLRICLPRRVYTQSHMDWLIEVFGRLAAKKDKIKGLEITYEPKRLRHFTARFRPVA